MLDLARPDQVLHRPRDVLDGHVRVDAVLVEQVDAVGLEPLERRLRHLPDVLGSAVERHLLPVLDLEPELGSDHHPVSDGGESLSDQFFVRERAVDLGGVEEGDPEIDGRADELDPLLRIDRRAVHGGTQAHAAQAQCRHFKVARSEFARFHVLPPSVIVGHPTRHRNSTAGLRRAGIPIVPHSSLILHDLRKWSCRRPLPAGKLVTGTPAGGEPTWKQPSWQNSRPPSSVT